MHVARCQLLPSLERSSSSSLADLDQRSAREEKTPDHRRWDQLLHRVYTLGDSDRQGQSTDGRSGRCVAVKEDESGIGSVDHEEQRGTLSGADSNRSGNG